jgi:UDP-glucose 4-epimerase
MSASALSGARVLVTGGLGFIGSNLARRCLELGAHVAIYDNLDPHGGGTLYNIADVRDAIELHSDDLLNFDALAKQVADRDFVFNCAASTSHPLSMREPWFDLDVNSRGVVNLLEAMRRFNRRAKLVHVGTSTQIGPLLYEPADERHPEFPTDIYSANKSASEKYVLIYARAHGLRAAVIRLANVFGPRATIRSAEFTFNNYFVGLALQDRDITIWGDGAQLRNVIYVDDAVAALLAAAELDASVGQTFFATGDQHFSVAQIAELTVRCIGSGRVTHVPWPAERKVVEIGHAVFSNAKIRATLGWRASRDIEDGLRRTRDYYAGCLQEYL